MIDIKFVEYDLQNGLHVILSPDRAAQVVAVDVWYHVGSKDEEPTRTGFAHLFEHMMFQGSANVGKTEHMKYVEQAGGSFNGSTTWDRTNYFETLPASQLEMGLWLESDRMLSLNISRENLNNQREVVKEERRWRVENRPYGTAWEKIFSLAYKTHPYRWPVVGYMKHLNAASVEDVRSFFNRFYRPNNAVVSIAGQFDTDEARALVEKYFAGISRGKEVKRRKVVDPPVVGQVRDTVYDNVALPAVYFVFRIPAATSEDSVALDLAANMLAHGDSSRLHHSLVYRKNLAESVDAFPVDMEDPGIFVINAVVSPGKRPEEVENAVVTQLEHLAARVPGKHELSKVKNQLASHWIRRMGRAFGRADALAGYRVIFGNTGGINEYIPKVLSKKAEEVSAAVKRYLSPANCVIIRYLPKNYDRMQKALDLPS